MGVKFAGRAGRGGETCRLLPHRGAKKLKAIREREHPTQPRPATSTVAGIPQQHGLIGRKWPRRVGPRGEPLGHAGRGPGREFRGGRLTACI